MGKRRRCGKPLTLRADEARLLGLAPVVKHLAFKQRSVHEHREFNRSKLPHRSFADLGPVTIRLLKSMKDSHGR